MPETNISCALSTSQTLLATFRAEGSGVVGGASAPRSVDLNLETESTIDLKGVANESFPPSGCDNVGLLGSGLDLDSDVIAMEKGVRERIL
jgi:hypothetical protein